jgi:propanediol utilization protein
MNEKIIRDILEKVVRDVLMEAAETPPSSPESATEGDPIAVEISARHVHLSEKDALALFGAPLTPAKDLSQPGQFVCKERVRLIGPRGVIDNVAILGPARSSSQVEISKTDARALGTEAVVRQSGDITGTPGVILASQTGIVGLKEGAIVAARHILMTPEDARRFTVADNDRVSVRINGDRPVILEDVIVRVSDNFRLAMHIDSDEGNSAGWKTGVSGKIMTKACEEACGLQRR